MTGEHLRRQGIGQPAAILDAAPTQGRQGFGGVADAVDVERNAGRGRRRQQEAFQLFAPLAVAPVADEHRPLALGGFGRRPEQAHVGGLVPDEHPPAPALPPIRPGQGLAEGQHAVVARKVERGDRLRIGDHPMMGVVEQQPEPAARGAQTADPRHQHGVIPFVHDDQVGVGAGRLGDGGGVAEAGGAELRIGFPPGFQTCLAVVAPQVGEAPGVFRLVGGDLVSSPHQLAQHAALEMGVAVVPAGAEGVGEVADPHAAASVRRERPASSSR